LKDIFIFNKMAPRRFLDNNEYSVAVPLYSGLEERRKSLNSVVNSSRKNFEKFKLQVSQNICALVIGRLIFPIFPKTSKKWCQIWIFSNAKNCSDSKTDSNVRFQVRNAGPQSLRCAHSCKGQVFDILVKCETICLCRFNEFLKILPQTLINYNGEPSIFICLFFCYIKYRWR